MSAPTTVRPDTDQDGHVVILGSCSCRCCCAGVWHCHRTGFGCYVAWESARLVNVHVARHAEGETS